MKYKIWLDDQSFDPNTPNRYPPAGYLAATSSQAAIDLIHMNGFPAFVDFDHDLGADDTAMTFLRQLQHEYDLSMVEPFEYRVHSANPTGSANIVSFMESWKKIYELMNYKE